MAAAAAKIAGRSTSTFARTILRTTTTARRLSKVSFFNDSLPANFTPRFQTRTLPVPSPSRLIRRELSTLVPVHTAISAACLVSKLPSEASTSNQAVEIWMGELAKLREKVTSKKKSFSSSRAQKVSKLQRRKLRR